MRIASRGKRVAISAPVRLANGDAGFYLAVPVEAHRFSGEVSGIESQSAVVGVVDAQELVAAQTQIHLLSLSLSERDRRLRAAWGQVAARFARYQVGMAGLTRHELSRDA